MRNKIAALVVLLVMVLSGCASYDTPNDQTTVEVNGYHLIKTDKTLVGCHGAGKAGWGGSGNDMFYYPAGQHTYSFIGDNKAELSPLPVVTKDNQTLTQPGFLKFTLTNDCKDLFSFHTKVGLKYRDEYGADWLVHFEKDYVASALSNGLNAGIGKYGWLEYYQSATEREQVEKALVADVQSAVNQSLGSSDWITINSVTLTKPEIPKSLQDGLEAVQAAQLNATAQQQQNEVNRKKYQSLADCVNGYTDDAGVKYPGVDPETCRIAYLANLGDVNFYPVPAGGSVVINGQPK